MTEVAAAVTTTRKTSPATSVKTGAGKRAKKTGVKRKNGEREYSRETASPFPLRRAGQPGRWRAIIPPVNMSVNINGGEYKIKENVSAHLYCKRGFRNLQKQGRPSLQLATAPRNQQTHQSSNLTLEK